MKTLKLSNLVASRICHDLAGPIGALLNGVELLREDDDPDMRLAALDLLQESLQQATGRLILYRLAFGASGGDTSPVSVIEAKAASDEYFKVGRINLHWNLAASSVDELRKNVLRLLLNLFLVAETAAPRGGKLEVEIVNTVSGGLQVSLPESGLPLQMKWPQCWPGWNRIVSRRDSWPGLSR